MPELNDLGPTLPSAARPAPEGDRTMAAMADPTSAAGAAGPAGAGGPAGPAGAAGAAAETETSDPTPAAAPAPTPPGGGGAGGGLAVGGQPPAGDPRGGARVAVLVIGALLAVTLAVAAGIQSVNLTTGQERRDEHVALPASVDRLEVRTSSGDLTFTGTAGDEAVVDARLSGTVHPPRLKVEIDGHTARVHADCEWQIMLSCEATLRLAVPAGVTVVGRSSSGDVQASGLTGPVDLRTSSGNVSADDCSGEARLSTSSGNVRATRLGSVTVSAHTSSGNVTLDMAVAPQKVDASSSSGNVRVTVPLGSATYDATAHTSSGSDSVRVATDPRSPRRIDARSSSGDVSIRYPDEA